MSSNEIFSVCQQLDKEGKEPSVALIKARLSIKQPLPTIVAGLKYWRANPNSSAVQEIKQETKSTILPLEQRVEQLEAEVSELKDLIRKLQAESAK